MRISDLSPAALFTPAELHRPEGLTGSYRITEARDLLATATIDISTSGGMLERLRVLSDVDSLTLPSAGFTVGVPVECW